MNTETKTKPTSGAEASPLELLVMRMAENRKEWNETKKAIDLLNCPDGDWMNAKYINLDSYRDYWWNELEMQEWHGWVAAVKSPSDYDSANDPATENELEMAALLDKRSKLKSELGQIRRSLCTMGRKLLRDA